MSIGMQRGYIVYYVITCICIIAIRINLKVKNTYQQPLP